MQFLLFISLCSGVVTGPLPWLNFEVSQDSTVEQQSPSPPPALLRVTCDHEKMNDIFQGSKPPCISHGVLERTLRASARLQVHGPEVQCERGGVCSVSVGSRVHVEVSLSSTSPSLGISLSLCALSPFSDPFNNSHLPLLVGGCPVEMGVTLHLDPHPPCSKDVPARSFSFQLGSFYNSSIQFLHCKVELCLSGSVLCRGMKRIAATALPKCPVPDNSCSSASPASSFPKSLFLRTVTQPLIVTISSSRSILQPNVGPRKPSRPPASTPTGELNPNNQWFPTTWTDRSKQNLAHVFAEERGQGIGMEAVAGVTLCSFVIGVMLSAGLWYIQSKTAPVSSTTNGVSAELRPSQS